MKKPPRSYSEMVDDVEEVRQRFERRKIDLSDEEKADLTLELRMVIDDWEQSRSGLEAKLLNWNDLMEGVTPQTNFPWPGASEVHVPMPKIKAREITSVINRSTMRPVPFLMTRYCGPSALYEESKKFTKELENFLEDKIKNDTNVHETLKECLVPIFRDGTVPVQIMWDTDYETVTDWKLYDSAQDFSDDYPSADDAGISKEKYRDIVKMLTNGTQYEAEFEYDSPSYDGPRASIVPLIHFVNWPVWVPRIRDMKVHGKRIWWTDYKLQDKVRMNMFEQEDVDKVLAFTGGELREDTVTASRDNIEGIARNSNRSKAKEFQIFELVYTGSLTEADKRNDVVRKHLIYYHYLSQQILRVESYPIRKGKPSYFVLRFLPRDNRFFGISLLDDISDLSAEIDINHRQRINSRTITHVPSFKAKMSAKTTFDPSRREFRFRPGATYYLGNMDDVQQFDIRPVDLSGSTEDEMLLYQLIDMTVGSSSANSGQSNPIDPRAPARKQQELLRQSSNRIDDYVQNLLPIFEDIGQFMIDLYYQYAPDRIKYYTSDEEGMIFQGEIERSKLFNPNVKFKVNGTSVFMSPELEFQREQEIYAIVGTDPITAQIPRIRRNALQRLYMAGRVPNPSSILPNQKEMPAAFTTDEQAERDARTAQSREKMIVKLGDAAAKREHELSVMKLQGNLDAQSSIIDAALAPPEVPDTGAAPGAPPVSFPVAPVAPGGAGIPGGPSAA